MGGEEGRRQFETTDGCATAICGRICRAAKPRKHISFETMNMLALEKVDTFNKQLDLYSHFY